MLLFRPYQINIVALNIKVARIWDFSTRKSYVYSIFFLKEIYPEMKYTENC